MSDLTGPRFEPQIFAPETNALPLDQLAGQKQENVRQIIIWQLETSKIPSGSDLTQSELPTPFPCDAQSNNQKQRNNNLNKITTI